MAERIDPKTVYKEKMQLALENFKKAEEEGAAKLAPQTYAWAKQKIYADKKIILQYPDDKKKVDEATDDASAAAAELLSTVRSMEKPKKVPLASEQLEKKAIDDLISEGGPVR